ncbi:HNH endonuclease [Pullulanibacillus sp. KACC 23026]|uniref:HNH endonuclease n=1 Tax=Pullulanibacillus sp. KACC 23026 TaxID=3028315 RepID=UPI0023B20075|nr:HNH endonuclease [Pullulanibacillus sp. KACC 23026]WEG14176.1 HNH endonuclease [Pullulanibacillus sp. KACC 23026]
MPRIDLTGQQFGDLTVLCLSDQKLNDGTSLWECWCTCGNKTYVAGYALRAGIYKSCGCKRAKKRDKGARIHESLDRVDGTRKSALKAKLHKENKSGHKGVMWLESKKKWKAYIGFKGKQINLGYFADKEEAIKARKEAEEKYHKPYLEGDQ